MRLNFFHEVFDGCSNRALDQDEIGDGDPMVTVDVSGEGSKCAVGHADAHGRRVLEWAGIESSSTFIKSVLRSSSYSLRSQKPRYKIV
jgi:hypothetical protein